MSEQIVNNRVDNALLVLQLTKGSVAAFDLLYQQYSTELFANILHIVKNREVAKELLQNRFRKFGKNEQSSTPNRHYIQR
ncbi:hypothetical protein [Pedobacter frigidisoli]|uniref:hypothetical protein n=1 Tax=Pedobacter frigidisoli TaxID=2530455 RepID=UPI0013F16F38|nr:hypothetical protein [Pedobacter frigidisoli]